MKPLRVAYITTGLHSGGAERMLFNVLSGLDRQRVEAVVISLIDQGMWSQPIAALGIPVHTIGMQPSKPTVGAQRRLMRCIRAARPDIIQGWMYHGNLAALLAALPHMRLPVCWNIQHSMYGLHHEKPLTAAVIGLGVALSHLPARIVYVSHVSRSQHQRLGYNSAKGCVIPNGVDTAVFHPYNDARRAVRMELGLPPDALLIGLIARFHPQKDHRTFLRAAADLAGTHADVYFILAGRGVDEQNRELTQLAQTVGLGDRVRFLGERTNMPHLTAALDLACSTSVFGEALSLALAEAMACGVPCVVTDIGDSAILVGQTGLVVPPGDAAALARAWRRLIDAGPATRDALGQLARQRIEQHYSLTQIVRDYENLYESLRNI